MRIGKVAKQVGMTVETIRFYEKQSLVKPPRRNESGYRDYPADIVPHLSFIKRAKELGFSLKEIRELLLLRLAPEASCGEVRKQAVAKIDDIERKIGDLQTIKDDLVTLVASCPGQGPVSKCPIISLIGMQGKRNE